MMSESHYRCLVPECASSDVTTPDKLWVALPNNSERRKIWLEAVVVDAGILACDMKNFLCEDHFNLEKDAEGDGKRSGKEVTVRPKCVPTKLSKLRRQSDRSTKKDAIEKIGQIYGKNCEKKIIKPSQNAMPDAVKKPPKLNPVVVLERLVIKEPTSDLRNRTTQFQHETIVQPSVPAPVPGKSSEPTSPHVPSADAVERSPAKELETCDICSPEQTLLVDPLLTQERTFPCGKCDVIFRLRSKMKRQLHHSGEKTFDCPYCDRNFAARGNLTMHLRRHNREKPFACPHYDHRFRVREHLRLHLERFECAYCGKCFRQKGSLRKHIASHLRSLQNEKTTHFSPEHKSPLSAAEPTSPRVPSADAEGIEPVPAKGQDSNVLNVSHSHKSIDRHLYKCVTCGEEFKFKIQLLKHEQNHSDSRREFKYVCVKCGNRFRTKGYLVRHSRIHTKRKHYPCVHCNRLFWELSNLNRHLLTYCRKMREEQAEMLECPDCGKHFGARGNLNHHRRIHSGEKPFACSACGSRFTTYGNLKQHLHIHTSEKRFVCPDCDNRFRLRSELDQHLFTHSSETTFDCADCGMRFRNRKYLKNHIRTHSSETPYACPDCSKRLRNHRDFKSHLLIHSGLKPFKCPHCDKCFRRPDRLTGHLATHSGAQPFKCADCGMSFRHKLTLLKHIHLHLRVMQKKNPPKRAERVLQIRLEKLEQPRNASDSAERHLRRSTAATTNHTAIEPNS